MYGGYLGIREKLGGAHFCGKVKTLEVESIKRLYSLGVKSTDVILLYQIVPYTMHGIENEGGSFVKSIKG